MFRDDDILSFAIVKGKKLKFMVRIFSPSYEMYFSIEKKNRRNYVRVRLEIPLVYFSVILLAAIDEVSRKVYNLSDTLQAWTETRKIRETLKIVPPIPFWDPIRIEKNFFIPEIK